MIRRVLGLDLGSFAVKAVELRQSLRSVEVAQLRSLPAAPDELPARLRELVTVHRLPTDYVVTAIPGDRTSSRRLELPFRDRRRLAQAVPFEVESQVPFDLEDVIVDWELVGGDRTRAEVVADVAPRAEVAGQLARLREAGLEPRIIEAEGLALANLSVLVPFPGSRLLVDVGHRTTVLCLCVDGRPLAARSFPGAGLAWTQALARDRGCSEAEAERVKCQSGLFGPGRAPATPGVGTALERWAREIARTLGGLEPVLAREPRGLEGVTLLGGSARLHRLDEFLAERLQVPVEKLAVPPGPVGSAILAGGDPLVFGPALALALRGSLESRTHRNFRKDEFAYRVDLRQLGRGLGSTARLAGLALGLGALLLLVSVLVSSRRASQAEAEVALAYNAIFPGQPVPADPLGAMRQAVSSAHERADALGVYRGNLSALDLLAEISARVPSELEVVFEELNIDRQVVRVRGTSKSFEGVDRLKSELARFEPFSSIQVSEIKDNEKRGGKSFSLTISMAQPRAEEGAEG